MNYIKNRFKAFGYAFSGLYQAFQNETHLKLFGIISLIIFNMAWFFSLTKTEWLIISFCIVLVISMELINSAIEKLCDELTLEKDPKIKYIKDVSSAAVLIVCIFAGVIGFLTFWPYFNKLTFSFR